MSDPDEELEESPDPDVDTRPTRARGTAKSGWCLEFNPGGHGRCPVNAGSFTCKCPCHDS